MIGAAIRRWVRWFLAAPAILPATMAIGHGLTVFWLSSLTGDDFGERGRWFGFLTNLGHAPLFATLGFLVAASCARRDSSNGPVFGWRRAAVAVTISQAYACFDEWHQSWVPGRSADPRDLVTDLMGVFAGVWVVHGVAGQRSLGAMARGLVLVGSLACVSAWFASNR